MQSLYPKRYVGKELSPVFPATNRVDLGLGASAGIDLVIRYTHDLNATCQLAFFSGPFSKATRIQ